MHLLRSGGVRREPLDVVLRPGEAPREAEEEARDLVDLGHVQVELDAFVRLRQIHNLALYSYKF